MAGKALSDIYGSKWSLGLLLRITENSFLRLIIDFGIWISYLHLFIYKTFKFEH